ncbi:MAG: hypothetical protein IH840_13860 [Candidatus Heimdallarchaeota archaeon]|nr:hypothetical protein [Candidatus Heimdallarchaeota archaeon]
MDLMVIIEAPVLSQYNHEAQIEFSVTDANGKAVSNVEVTLTYAPVSVEYQDTQVLINGQTVFIYLPLDIGTLQLNYRIIDANNNYLLTEGLVNLEVEAVGTTISISWNDSNGDLVLEVLVMTDNNLPVLDPLVVQIYIYDTDKDQYVLFATDFLVEGRQRFPMAIVGETILIHVVVENNENVSGGEVRIQIGLVDHQTTFGDLTVSTYTSTDLTFQMLGNGSLDRYEVSLYVLVYGNWELMFTTLSINGSIEVRLDIVLPAGVYEMRLEIPAQGWYNPYQHTAFLTIKALLAEIASVGEEVLLKGESNILIIQLVAGDSYDYSGSIVYLYIELQEQYEYLMTGTANTTGHVVFEMFVQTTWPLGDNMFLFKVQSDDYLAENNVELSFSILQDVGLLFDVNGSPSLDNGGEIGVTLFTTSGQPLAGETIQLYLITPSGDILLMAGETDSDGFTMLQIPSNIQHWLVLSNGSVQITLRLVYQDTSETQEMVDQEVILIVLVTKKTLHVTIDLTDNGFTHGYEITVNIHDLFGDIDPALGNAGNLDVQWALNTKSGAQIAADQVLWNEFFENPTIYITEDFSGTMVFRIFLLPSMDSIYQMTEILDFEFVRSAIIPELILDTPRVDLVNEDIVKLHLQSNGMVLRDVTLDLQVNDTTLQVTSGNNGEIVISINHFFIGEGNYTFSFSSCENFYLSPHVWNFEIAIGIFTPTFDFDFVIDPVDGIYEFYPDDIISIKLHDDYRTDSEYRISFVNDDGEVATEGMYQLSSESYILIEHDALLPGNYLVIVERVHDRYDVMVMSRQIVIQPIEITDAQIVVEADDSDLVIFIDYDETLLLPVRYNIIIVLENGTKLEFVDQLNVTLPDSIFQDNEWMDIEVRFMGFYSGVLKQHFTDPSFKDGNILDLLQGLAQNSESIFALISIVAGVGLISTVGRKLRSPSPALRRDTKHKL